MVLHDHPDDSTDPVGIHVTSLRQSPAGRISPALYGRAYFIYQKSQFAASRGRRDVVTRRTEKFKLFVRNVVTGGMFDRYDIETTRRIIMLNVLIIAGVLFLVAYSIEYVYIAAYRMAVLDMGAATILILTAIHVRRTQTYIFASNAAIVTLGILFLYLTIVGGFNNTGYLWAFLFPLLSVIHFGLKQGTVAISLFLGVLIFLPPPQNLWAVQRPVRT